MSRCSSFFITRGSIRGPTKTRHSCFRAPTARSSQLQNPILAATADLVLKRPEATAYPLHAAAAVLASFAGGVDAFNHLRAAAEAHAAKRERNSEERDSVANSGAASQPGGSKEGRLQAAGAGSAGTAASAGDAVPPPDTTSQDDDGRGGCGGGGVNDGGGQNDAIARGVVRLQAMTSRVQLLEYLRVLLSDADVRVRRAAQLRDAAARNLQSAADHLGRLQQAAAVARAKEEVALRTSAKEKLAAESVLETARRDALNKARIALDRHAASDVSLASAMQRARAFAIQQLKVRVATGCSLCVPDDGVHSLTFWRASCRWRATVAPLSSLVQLAPHRVHSAG
jgi:hypothetical protein